ncbi:MAG: hypothetical protein ABSG65_03250 [Bryobacteraceae bacterium]
MLVDQKWNWRENQALERRLKNAKLRTDACVEEIDYRGARGLDKSLIRCAGARIGLGRNTRKCVRARTHPRWQKLRGLRADTARRPARPLIGMTLLASPASSLELEFCTKPDG